MGQKMIGIVALYFFTRITFIFRYPIFNDESIYLHYARIMMTPGNAFHSLSMIGKQPLILWLYGIAMKLGGDPLLAGRMVSLALGCLTLYVLYRVTKSMYSHTVGLVAACLYVLTPAIILFDGMAVPDNALSLIFLLLLWVFTAGYKTHWIRKAIIIGVLVGVGFWVKTTALLFACVAFLLVVLHVFQKKIHVLRALCVLAISSVVSLSFMLPLVMRPEFERFYVFQEQYAYTVAELLRFPLGTWLQNALSYVLLVSGYVFPFLFVFVGMTLVNLRHAEKTIPAMVCWLFAVLLLVLTSRQLHTRYLLFSIVPLLILAASFLSGHRVLRAVTVAIMGLATCLFIISPPAYFRLFPPVGVYASETWQYIEGWPSGYGVMEAIDWVVDKHTDDKVLMAVRWDSGNPEDAVWLYADVRPDTMVVTIDGNHPVETAGVLERAMGKPIYLVTRKGQKAGLESILTLVARFDKPGGQEAVEVYQARSAILL